jgi:hypothetical protein
MSFRKPEGYFNFVDEAVVAMQRRGGYFERNAESDTITAVFQARPSDPKYVFRLTKVDDRCTTPEYVGKWYWLEQDPVMPKDDPVDHVMYVFKTLSKDNRRRFLAKAQAY